MKATIIFPAFVREYTGSEQQAISSSRNDFARLLATASDTLRIDLTGFDFANNNFLDDELRSQYISYIFSCAVSDILKKKGIAPSYVSGYSMGLYAALYYCRSVSFLVGLKLIENAWEEISVATADGHYGMGMIMAAYEYGGWV